MKQYFAQRHPGKKKKKKKKKKAFDSKKRTVQFPQTF